MLRTRARAAEDAAMDSRVEALAKENERLRELVGGARDQYWRVRARPAALGS